MIISPKYDEAMRQLFCNETVRLHFLSDVLDIPLEEIRSTRLVTPFLRNRFRRQKQGILDVQMEMNDEARVNVEIQLRAVRNWDKRQLYYLSQMYTSDLWTGEKYEKLKRSIGISILDFNLTEGERNHTVYRLRDEEGNEFTDLMEIHVLELRKKCSGKGRADEWIELFNVETEEELEMLGARTGNPGILEAIREIRRYSLVGVLRYEYESYLKAKRDQWAREDYVRDEGREEGQYRKVVGQVCRKLRRGAGPEAIAEALEEDADSIRRICEAAKGFAPDYPFEEVWKQVQKQREEDPAGGILLLEKEKG